MWNYMILGLLVVMFAILWVRFKVEYFANEEPSSYPGNNALLQYENTGPNVWDRHPVQTSVLTDMKAKFDKAYNYELENEAYKQALFKTFNVSKTCINEPDWGVVEPNNRTVPSTVVTAYEEAIRTISNILKTSEHLRLPGESLRTFNPIQVVHDKLISYRRNKRTPAVLLEIQMVLYREAKYHGKDVSMMVLVDRNKGSWSVKVVDAWISGVIFEDKIALFPVQGVDSNINNIDLSTPMFPEPKFASFDDDVQFYEYCASTNLDENKRMACIDVIQNTR